MAQAVLQMTKILTAMQKDRSNDLENLLDRSDGGGDGASGSGGSRSKSAAFQKLKTLLKTAPEQISASIETLMSEDFAQVQSGPRQQDVCMLRPRLDRAQVPSSALRWAHTERLAFGRHCRCHNCRCTGESEGNGASRDCIPRSKCHIERIGFLRPNTPSRLRRHSPRFNAPGLSMLWRRSKRAC